MSQIQFLFKTSVYFIFNFNYQNGVEANSKTTKLCGKTMKFFRRDFLTELLVQDSCLLRCQVCYKEKSNYSFLL